MQQGKQNTTSYLTWKYDSGSNMLWGFQGRGVSELVKMWPVYLIMAQIH